MRNPVNSLYNIRQMEDLARGYTFVHKIHPLVKLSVTIGYILAVISFGKYEISNLIPFIIYPILLIIMLDIPAGPVVRRILMVEPLIVALGIFSPLLDRQPFQIGNVTLAAGWLAFLSILLKGSLSVAAVVVLVASTGMDKIAGALRMLHIPRIFVLQLLLTYRYLSLLAEEAGRLMRAYTLRTPGHRGVAHTAWGSLAGGLLLRAFDRAQRVYQAMCLRGFDGEYNVGTYRRIGTRDFAYLTVWFTFVAAARFANLPVLFGAFLSGVLG